MDSRNVWDDRDKQKMTIAARPARVENQVRICTILGCLDSVRGGIPIVNGVKEWIPIKGKV